MDTHGRDPFVVVGVDGSPNSMAALRRAAAEAARRQALLQVVYVYHPSPPAPYHYAALDYPFAPQPEVAGAEDDFLVATRLLDTCVAQVFDGRPPPRLRLLALTGNAHHELVRLAQGAELLVVGARGYSGALHHLVGSTARACADDAPCPVLIVPAEGQGAPAA